MLEDHRRFTRKVFSEVMRDDLSRDRETAALRPDEHRNCLTLVKVRLPPNGRHREREPNQTYKNTKRLLVFHNNLLATLESHLFVQKKNVGNNARDCNSFR